MTNSERYLEESLAGEGGTSAVFQAYDVNSTDTWH